MPALAASTEHGAGTDPQQPRFTVVSAVHNVARFLPDFIDSVEKQTFPLDRLQIILVDDGSTDDSLALLRQWQARRPDQITVLTQPNQGQGAARNVGIDHATGEWLTFPDPDDMLDEDYFERVDSFLRAHLDTEMVATNRIMFYEETNEISENHPLRRMFAGGDRLVDLNRFPDFFHGSAPAAFFRTDLVHSAQLKFDVEIRPNFEDGHFCVRYLLLAPSPLLGYLQSARYVYRKRVDASSTLQNSLGHDGRYLVVPRRGYLDVLERGAAATGGSAPEWVQNFVLYELTFYFAGETAVSVAGTAAQGEVADAFVDCLREIVQLLDPIVVEGFALRRMDRVWRDILLHGLQEQPWITPYAVVEKWDEVTREVRIAYRFVGPPPNETILFRGRPVAPRHAKIRSHVYFDRTLMSERVVWAPAGGTLRLMLNGKPVELRPEWAGPAATTVRPYRIEHWFGSKDEQRRVRDLSVADRALLVWAKSPAVRKLYGNAWVLMDRLHDADDNAERLFRYLRERRRDINAWFVIEEDTPDWNRLKAAGYKRLVAYGSRRWKLLMLNCVNLISSHADAPVHRPEEILRLTDPTWRFAFLQHGVIKDDISRWLNPKKIDLFVTSTTQEHESIVGDHTPYAFTSKEVRMTGLPRFDRLRQLGGQIPPAQRNLILVSPTWRQWLNVPKARGSHRRVVTDDFFSSEYVAMWQAFLQDERLHRAAERHGLEIGFLPHPNIQPALADLDIPASVRPLTFTDNDVQRLFASAALMVTDYSSMAFNAAYLDRPVVYFQFDAETVLGGGHTGRYGYYDYGRDGFGPVARTVDETVAAVESLIDGDDPLPAQYRARIEATFPNRDGRCCERTVEAIIDLGRRRARALVPPVDPEPGTDEPAIADEPATVPSDVATAADEAGL